MESIWKKSVSLPVFPALEGDLSCQVVVVGGGMAGILTAWDLQRRGVEVVVLEARQPGRGVTGNTTAKITSQHRLIYHNLISGVGEERARQYAAVNQAAIVDYATIVEELNISCGFRHAPAYVYDLKNGDAIQREYTAARYLNISAELTQETELPFSVAQALKFPNQALFHPLEFLSALLPQLTIYGNTTAQSITAEGLCTDRGLVRARHIVVTTHFPFFNLPGLYFARMHQDSSYVLAIQDVPSMNGMYIDAAPTGRSFRCWGDLTLLGGEGHRAGKTPGDDGYCALRKMAKEWWPKSKIVSEWSAQDCMTMDGIPYIGAYPSDHASLYVATGFGKWGMTSSMAASHILSDLITGVKNPNTEVFSPHRLPTLPALSNLMKDGGISAKYLLSQAFYIPQAQFRDIEPGQGGVVSWHGKKMGVFHSENGQYFLVPSRCPHLGCQLAWNTTERTWDCPCHGSRFTYRGERLESPSTDRLECHLFQS